MAPKRRVTIQSDSEDEAPRSTQHKRQRTSAEDAEAAVDPVNNGIDEEEERQFEREHEEAFMQRVQERADDVKKQKVVGVRLIPRLRPSQGRGKLTRACQGVAAMGIITKVEMVDFMCHAYLEFNFGPQINFIIGKCFSLPVHRNAYRGFYIPQVTTAVSWKS